MSDTHPVPEDGPCCPNFTRGRKLAVVVKEMTPEDERYDEAVRLFTLSVANCPTLLGDLDIIDYIAELAALGYIRAHAPA